MKATSIVALILALFLTSTGARAAGDPTQPPGVFAEPTTSGVSESVNVSRLQSVILHKKGKKSLALIDGQTYAVGDMVGDAKLVKISERSVILRGSRGKEELLLTPEVEVTPVIKKKMTGPNRGGNP